MSADYSELENLLKELLDTMGFTVTVSRQTSHIAGQNGVVFHINAPEHSHLLIGQHGVNLEALQHTFRVLARKRIHTDIPPFALDVNNYWQDKSVALIREAHEAAEVVARDRSTHILRPMTAFERKIVHAALTDFPGVETESTGRNEARKVIIKPASLLEA